MTARLAAATLALEAFVVFFATLVAVSLSDVPDGAVWTAGGGLALACLLAAGLARRPVGLVIGWVLQAALVATGIWVPAMFALGAVFVAVWAWLLSVGRRIDRDRAAWAADDQGAGG